MAALSNALPLTIPDLLFYHPQTESTLADKLDLGMIVVALQPQLASQLVWAPPLSLAATCGISSISFPPLT